VNHFTSLRFESVYQPNTYHAFVYVQVKQLVKRGSRLLFLISGSLI